MVNTSFILNKTESGLEIFRKYINHNFSVGESFEKGQERFTILWSEQYQNYILRHEQLVGKRWRWYQNYNAIYFLQEKFGLKKEEVFEMLEREMNLKIPADSVTPAVESNETNLLLPNSDTPTVSLTNNINLNGF